MMAGRTRPTPSRLVPAGAFAAVFLVGLRVHCQGFNLLDDGLWVLGARVVADGGVLYRDLFTIYGPARYLFVLPFFLVTGKSVLALAAAKAFSDGLAAAVGMWGTRRLGAGKWAWLVPVGVIALGPIQPRYVAAGVLAFTAAGVLSRGLDLRRGVLLGLGWGGLALFGLDMAGYGAVILGLGFLVEVKKSRTDGYRSLVPWSGILVGAGAILAGTVVVSAVGGGLGDMTWDTVIYPVTRFKSSMGLSWWHDFGNEAKLGEVFSFVFTGENLSPAWPGHVFQRILALRVLYLLIWVLPVAGVLGAFLSPRQAWAPVAGLALAGWATLLGRGDPSHLAMAWYGSLVLAPLILADLAAWRRPVGIVAGVALAAVAAPLFMEHAWLAVHLGRPSLERWQRPTAGIFLGSERIKGLDKMLGSLSRDPRIPLVAWPVQPGLIFLQGSALATPQTTLLAGEVRDPGRVVADLERTKPPVIIQGRAAGVIPGVRTFRGLAPSIYPYVRTHYTVGGSMASDRENYRLLVRHEGDAEEITTLPLKKQLPTAGQQVKVSYTPLIVGEMNVAQTLRVREFEFHGVVVKLAAKGPYPATIPVRMTILELLPSGKGVVRRDGVTPVVFHKEVENVEFTFPGVPGSIGKTMIFMISNGEPAGPAFRAVWDMPKDGAEPELDFYPEGFALVAGERTAADLYFLAY